MSLNPDEVCCWVAYFTDFSGFAVFTDETSALRYAVKNQMMHVALVPYGMDVRECISNQTA